MTPVCMLTARTQQPLTAPEELGPLGPAIDRAGAIDPDERYPNAGTMRAALADAGDELPPPGPLTLAGMTDRADPHPTRAAPVNRLRVFDQDFPDAPNASETQPVLTRDGRTAPWMLDSLRVTLTARGAELAGRCLLALLARSQEHAPCGQLHMAHQRCRAVDRVHHFAVERRAQRRCHGDLHGRLGQQAVGPHVTAAACRARAPPCPPSVGAPRADVAPCRC